jgi:2-polyprenyl-6-methoxyphenol hydroxylase-like FAD-dependent oxidoreductase
VGNAVQRASRGAQGVDAAIGSYVARRKPRVATVMRISREVGKEGQAANRVACWRRNRRIRRAGRSVARAQAELERLLSSPG